MDFVGIGARLNSGDIATEAQRIGCDPAAIRMIVDVETAGSGFMPDGRPKILFEAHQFYRETGGRFGSSNVSSSRWDPTLYGSGGAHQYERLAQAIALDARAALASASWGLGQIMGTNFALVGYPDVEHFVEAMKQGEAQQLDAMLKFIRAAGLEPKLKAVPPSFAALARGYNGPGYAEHGYDLKLAAAWRKWRAEENAQPTTTPRSTPELYHTTLQLHSVGDDVRDLQQRLAAMGYDIPVDGDFGPLTMAAVVAEQHKAGLPADGIVGPRTRAAIAAG